MARRLLIRGPRVTEVGYRLFLFQRATALGLTGFYARNLNGALEVLADGPEAALEEFVGMAMEERPPVAEVQSVEVAEHPGPVPDVESFYRVFSLEQLVKIVQAGVQMLEKQDQLLEKQDLMLEKQDRMLEKQDLMLGKMDQVLGKQDLLVTEVRSAKEELKKEIKEGFDRLRLDLNSLLDERLRKIEEDLALIKARLGMS
ncbi:MAG: acylphosphatase [Candidatus Korarchaeota archaeon]|nr:acylphosphatase [Candidatus Korarchaeota archaeon]